jgi:hypothetical protein
MTLGRSSQACRPLSGESGEHKSQLADRHCGGGDAVGPLVWIGGKL